MHVVTLHHLKERSHSSHLLSRKQCGIICAKMKCTATCYKKLQLSLVHQHRPYNTAGARELLFWVNGVTEVKLQLCQVPLLRQHFPLLSLIHCDTPYSLWGKQGREKLCCHSRCTLIRLQGGLGCFRQILPRIWVVVGLWPVSLQVLRPLQVSALCVL